MNSMRTMKMLLVLIILQCSSVGGTQGITKKLTGCMTAKKVEKPWTIDSTLTYS